MCFCFYFDLLFVDHGKKHRVRNQAHTFTNPLQKIYVKNVPIDLRFCIMEHDKKRRTGNSKE